MSVQHFDCRNHIRVIQPMSKNRLYICGTNAHNPKDWVIYVSNLPVPTGREWRLFIVASLTLPFFSFVRIVVVYI